MILLIAAILGKQELADLAGEAEALGMHVLLEVHDEAELEKYVPSIGFVGVNNRDLKTFQVDTGRSLDLIGKMPEGVIPVSESGINSPGEIALLFEAGFKLFPALRNTAGDLPNHRGDGKCSNHASGLRHRIRLCRSAGADGDTGKQSCQGIVRRRTVQRNIRV